MTSCPKLMNGLAFNLSFKLLPIPLGLTLDGCKVYILM